MGGGLPSLRAFFWFIRESEKEQKCINALVCRYKVFSHWVRKNLPNVSKWNLNCQLNRISKRNWLNISNYKLQPQVLQAANSNLV